MEEDLFLICTVTTKNISALVTNIAWVGFLERKELWPTCPNVTDNMSRQKVFSRRDESWMWSCTREKSHPLTATPGPQLKHLAKVVCEAAAYEINHLEMSKRLSAKTSDLKSL